MNYTESQQHWDFVQRTALALNMEALGVADVDLHACEPYLKSWLDEGFHGEMDFMARHGLARLDVNTVLEGAIRVVSFRIPYLPAPSLNHVSRETTSDNIAGDTVGSLTAQLSVELDSTLEGITPKVSLYARGRDYHKVIRNKLAQISRALNEQFPEFKFRAAVDSAPVAEVELARKAGLGWRGKHTLLIHPKKGSLFFLGEILTNMPLPLSGEFEAEHCGQCNRCIEVCPTQAIVAPYTVDARRCISYLTIEHKGPIPEDLRPAIGTRVYGCDDCQLVCPWNKFAEPAVFADFNPRPIWQSGCWGELLALTEAEFLKHTEGSAIRRLGYARFMRNLVVACGNAKVEGREKTELLDDLIALEQRWIHEGEPSSDFSLREHTQWAISRLKP